MRAVVITHPGDPDVLRVEERPLPTPGPKEVRIRVEAAGVCRADTLQRRGFYPPPAGVPADIPGLEVSGTIDAVGENVKTYARDERVCALLAGGGYAEYAVAPVQQVLPQPSGWTAIESATLPENTFTVYDNVVTRAHLSAGESFMTHGGTSGIGSTAIMLARALRAHPILATAGSQQKCDAAKSFGADAAIDYKETDFVKAVLDATNGRGVDVILDIVGGDYVDRDMDALALDGRVTCLAHTGKSTITVDLSKMLGKRLTLIASSLRSRTPEQKGKIRDALLASIWPLLPKKDPIRPVVDSVFTFEEAPRAHAKMEASEHIGKIVLVP
jgi:putative PIG3 family NAD(P)H quinone oxidoreductase